MYDAMAQATAGSVDTMTKIAISEPVMWWYGEMDTVFALALVLLVIYGLQVWDSYRNYD